MKWRGSVFYYVSGSHMSSSYMSQRTGQACGIRKKSLRAFQLIILCCSHGCTTIFAGGENYEMLRISDGVSRDAFVNTRG